MNNINQIQGDLYEKDYNDTNSEKCNIIGIRYQIFVEKILERKLMNRSPGGRFPRIWRNIKKLGDMRTIE